MNKYFKGSHNDQTCKLCSTFYPTNTKACLKRLLQNMCSVFVPTIQLNISYSFVLKMYNVLQGEIPSIKE